MKARYAVLFLMALVLFGSFFAIKRHEAGNDYWGEAEREVYRTSDYLKKLHQEERSQGVYYKILMQGNPRIKAVALTFDDGPHPDFTPKILKILKDSGIKATFFVIGKMAEKYPDLIDQIDGDGHTIGNHSYHHINLTKVSYERIKLEWQATTDVIRSITGHDTVFCRPPGGDYNKEVIDATSAEACTTVLWTDDPGDYADPGKKIIEGNVLENLSNGGIILLHDGSPQTLAILPELIRRIKNMGFEFETLNEMEKQLK